MRCLMNDQSLRSKVLFSFAIVFVVTAALGALAAARLGELSRVTQDINSRIVPSTRLVGEIGIASERYRSQQGITLLTKDPAQKESLTARIQLVVDKRQKVWEQLGSLLNTAQGRELYETSDRLWETYRAAGSQMLELDRQGRTDEAIAVLNDSLQKAMDRYRKSFQALFDYLITQSEAAEAHSEALRSEANLQIFGALAAALLLALFAARTIICGVSGPVGEMSRLMHKMAGRDLSAPVPCLERKDEIGEMARAVAVFKDSMIEAEQLNAEKTREHQEREARAKHIEALTKSFGEKIGVLVGGLSSAATQLRATAQSMRLAAEQTNDRSVVVASAAEQASGSVQTVASAAEELASSITEIGRQVVSSNSMAQSASHQAQEADGTVQTLAVTAKKIGGIVSLITEIASQTNLLALNATIEAARAGEAGKGFAVVAGEVKSLASQTGRATEEISAEITQIQQATRSVVEAIAAIGSKIDGINQVSAIIDSSVRQQQEATQEIASTIQQTAQGTSEVSSNIVGVKDAAAQTGAAAAQVLSAAGSLAEEAADIAREVELFIAGIKNA